MVTFTPVRAEIRQELRLGGRLFELELTPSGDDRVRVELIAANADGEIITSLGGVLPAGDLPIAATALSRLMASAAAILGLETPQAKPSPATPRSAKYPNTGTLWDPADDAALTEAFRAGTDVAALAERFGRRRSAIRSRLVKHGLMDAEEAGLRWR